MLLVEGVVRFLFGLTTKTRLRLVGLKVGMSGFGLRLKIGGGRMFVRFLLGVFI
jgi:hypothetical protein